MDTGEGKFVPIATKTGLEKIKAKYPNHGGWFHVGEQITVRGSRFRIKSVKPTELRLKLLPKGK